MFDNGPDYFSDGLARIVSPSGKFGFINKKLEVVIEPQFDFVTPFDEGRAHVCEGCRPVPMGESSRWEGGVEWPIDTTGQRLEAPTPHR